MRLSVPFIFGYVKTRSFFKNIAIFLIVFLALSLFFKNSVFAQTQVNEATQIQPYIFSNNSPEVPRNLSTYTQNVVIELLGALGCQLAGSNPVSTDHRCLGYDKITGQVNYVNSTGGAIGFLGNMITVLYTPPIHSTDYVNYLANNFGLVKGAYAQYGVGMESISPISGLFVTFRNISYFIFVIIFVFIGLGIMLRLRIDPRTVMTIQNQIPRVIIGIILITLSFAISGLMIDLMWVLMIAIINTLQGAHPQLATAIGENPNLYNTTFSLSGIVGGFFGVANDTAGSIGNTINAIFTPSSLGSAIELPTGTVATGTPCNFWDIGCWLSGAVSTIGTAVGTVISAVLGFILGWVVGVFAWFVIIIAVIVSLFKLWFALLKAYIMVIFDIIFAPFWIIAGLIPGAGPHVGFTAWLRDLAGNLMAFPVVIGLFMIARIIADGLTTNTSFFMPPLLGGPDMNIGAIISFGIILSSPKIVDMVKAALKASGPNPGMGGVGTGIAAVGAVGGAIKRRAYWRDSSGQTHGIAANAGRTMQRRISNSGAAGRVSSTANRIPGVGSLRRNVGNWTDEAKSRASMDEYRIATKGDPITGKIQSIEEQKKERSTTERATSNRELAQELGGAVVEKLKDSGVVGGSGNSGGSGGTGTP